MMLRDVLNMIRRWQRALQVREVERRYFREACLLFPTPHERDL